MAGNRNEKITEALRIIAAEFLAREAGRESLITVTRAELSDDGKRGVIFISVFPTTAEESALAFAQRNRGELGLYFREHLRGASIPHVEFRIDLGEKNRQRLDELSN